MAWTYGGDLTNSPRDALRALIDDVNEATPLIQDEVLDYLISQQGSTYAAAAAACDILAMRFAGEPESQSLGKVSWSYAGRSEAYAARAVDLRRQDKAERGVIGAVFLSGGRSYSEKIRAQSNPDEIQPAFTVEGNEGYAAGSLPCVPSVSLKWIRGR
jgi:hypothetical protein